jgi:ATPase family associated with various cellular activities (AAA)/Clp amino terminal domain, pathogenicity island component
MNTVTSEMHSHAFDFDRLAPSTQAEIHKAQQEAASMNAPEVYPEHLFLGVIALADAEVAKVLDSLGLDIRVIQAQVAEIFGMHTNEGLEESNLPLSRESQICFEWAFTFALQMHSSLIFPKHLLLGVLRHPRVQPLLVLLLPSEDALPASLREVAGPAYTSYIDQLIHSRVRDQSVVGFNKSFPKRVLRRFERPGIIFADIQGLDRAKHDLREVVEFLRKPQIFRHSRRTYLYGVLVVGHPCTDRTLLVEATAGEAVVPLISLSISTLVEMLAEIDSDVTFIEDLDLPADEYNLLKNSEASQRGQNMLEYIFEQARKASPCILFIDNLDAINQLISHQERERLWKQLVVEMDGPDYHPPMAVLATSSRTDSLDHALLSPGRLERQVVMSNSFMAQPAAQTKLCLSCKNEGLSYWKYCVYCGALLALVCPNCGTPSLQIEGALFCFECGSPWSGIQ